MNIRDEFEQMLREAVDKRPDQPADDDGIEAAFKRLDEQRDRYTIYNPNGEETI